MSIILGFCGVEPIFRQHLLNYTAGSLKLSILGKVEGSQVIFSEVGGHDELRTARR